VPNGVVLSVMGAVQYGTSKVFYKVVPQFDTEGFRQYSHQIMALFGQSGKEVVMVVERRGIHRTHKLASTLTHWHARFRLHFLPARCGHHRNPIEVCQTQPIKMTWCPLRLFRQTRRIREEPVAVPVLHRLVALGINAGSQSLHRAPPRPRLTT
jgi:DDE superfamily endonuclease